MDETPKREQEILSLERDYSNIKSVYSSLLSRKLEAEIAVNMEKKQKGEQFRILDFARMPSKPISPDLKKIMVMSIAVGLGIGCGLALLMEILNTSLKNTDDMESYLGASVLASIPQIKNMRDIKMMRINHALSIVVLLISLFFVCCLALFSFKGVDQTLELIKYPMQAMINRP